MDDPSTALIADLHKSGLPAVVTESQRKAAICKRFANSPWAMAAEIAKLQDALAEMVRDFGDCDQGDMDGADVIHRARALAKPV